MNELDQALERIAQMKGEPAPAYIYDITGLGYKAVAARTSQGFQEWKEGLPPLPYNDEIPY